MGNIKQEFTAKLGETWFIHGEPYIVEGRGYSYFDTNGDPSTKYVTMHALDGTQYIITEKAFIDKAQREEPLVERFVTPDQILRASPCEDGVRALFQLIGVNFSGNPYIAGANLATSGKRSQAYSTQKLYDEVDVPDSWLLFVAKVLNLVPKASNGPDRATLLRLLGIKD